MGHHCPKGANGDSPGSQPWEHRPKQISSPQRGERSQPKIRVVHRRPHRFGVTPQTARPDVRSRCRPEQRIGLLGRELDDRPQAEADSQRFLRGLAWWSRTGRNATVTVGTG